MEEEVSLVEEKSKGSDQCGLMLPEGPAGPGSPAGTLSWESAL